MDSKLKKKIASSGIEHLDLIMYSKDAFLKCNCGSEDDFYNIDFPENTAYYYLNELKDVKSLKSIRFPVIDQEYFDYIQENDLEDSDEVRMQYISTLTDDDCERLWLNTELNNSVDWGILPIVAVNDKAKTIKTNCHLSTKTVEQVKRHLLNTFNEYVDENNISAFELNEDDVYLCPVLIDMQYFTNEEENDEYYNDFIENLLVCGEEVLKGNEVDVLQYKQSQIISPDEIMKFYGILFMYKYKTPAIITKEYFNNVENRRIDSPTIDTEEIEKHLDKDLKFTYEVLTQCLIYPECFDQVIEEFTEILQGQAERQTNNIDNLYQLSSGHTVNKSKKTKNKNKKRNTDF